jgi:hypothetical protein
MDDENILKTYRRMNKYHIVNGTQIASKGLVVHINCNDPDGYDIDFVYVSKISEIKQHLDIKNISFDTLWKIIKPQGTHNVDAIKRILGKKIRFALPEMEPPCSDISIRVDLINKLYNMIRNKIYATETAFKQRLLHCSQTDCKIDFF